VQIRKQVDELVLYVRPWVLHHDIMQAQPIHFYILRNLFAVGFPGSQVFKLLPSAPTTSIYFLMIYAFLDTDNKT